MSELETEMTAAADTKEKQRCGFAAIIGAPNAGKSTLTNNMVGTKVSIVTHKVQTTRANLRGIFIENNTQVILVDTPGIFAAKKRLDHGMVNAAWGGAKDADLVIVLIDAAKGIDKAEERILEGLQNLSVPLILALNKIDRLKKEELLALAQTITARAKFDETFMISALKGSGVDDLKAFLVSQMPEGPWLYPDDQIADAPLRYTAAEITREKIFIRLHEELPYASTVETTQWKTLKDKSIRVEQTIFVETSSQKKIVIGAKGQTIKKISMDAREEIAEIASAPVHLFLFVKVRENWSDDPERYAQMGLEFPKKPGS